MKYLRHETLPNGLLRVVFRKRRLFRKPVEVAYRGSGTVWHKEVGEPGTPGFLVSCGTWTESWLTDVALSLRSKA